MKKIKYLFIGVLFMLSFTQAQATPWYMVDEDCLNKCQEEVNHDYMAPCTERCKTPYKHGAN